MRIESVAEARVAPAVVADQRGVVVEPDHAAGAEPSHVRTQVGQGRDPGPDLGDRAPVEVVVAEDEPHR